MSEPTTLGEKLAPVVVTTQEIGAGRWLLRAYYTTLNVACLTALTTVPLWWRLMQPEGGPVSIACVLTLIVLWLLSSYQRRSAFREGRTRRGEQHILLANDRVGFMADLRLDAKTVLFDGSNIYHFGASNELGARPLGLIARQMRAEGYRVVCFFDANIFYTLSDHGVFPEAQRHFLTHLERLFGLMSDEIFIVPSGVDADKYILESLKHLPISFAITNDQFRDYAKAYPNVMKGNQWRKGVIYSKNEIKLLQHRLLAPIRLN